MISFIGIVLFVLLSVASAVGFAAAVGIAAKILITGTGSFSRSAGVFNPARGLGESRSVSSRPKRANYSFSRAERSFFEILRSLARGHVVFAKVRLADLVSVSKETDSSQTDLNRIDSKLVDFVVCDRDLTPVLAIELDHASHDPEDVRTRDAFVDEVLADSHLPVMHVRAQEGYALEEVRDMIQTQLHKDQPWLAAKLTRTIADVPLKYVA